MSIVMRKPVLPGVLSRCDSNKPAQLQRNVNTLKFCIKMLKSQQQTKALTCIMLCGCANQALLVGIGRNQVLSWQWSYSIQLSGISSLRLVFRYSVNVIMTLGGGLDAGKFFG